MLTAKASVLNMHDANRAELKIAMDFIERGGRTLRCHTIPLVHSQSVAAHSFGVAMWCHLLAPERKPSAALLMAALMHDIAEHETGDVPSPTKDKLVIRTKLDAYETSLTFAAGLHPPELTEDETRLLRLADSLELMQLCVRERVIGNRNKQIEEMYHKVGSHAAQLCRTTVEYDAYDVITANWREA